MKKLKNALILLSIVVLIASCSKDDNETPSQVFTAKLGSSDFNADEVFGIRYSNDVSIVGLKKDDSNISISFIDGEVAPGTYNFASDDEIHLFYYNGGEDASSEYYAESGSITVTTVSQNRFEATFTVLVINVDGEEINITNGVVKTSIQE